MIKALSLAAALALLPLSASVAGEVRGPSEDALEAAAEAFEARMEAFGERAEAISEDGSLSESERETRIAVLWAEYEPDVQAFTATVSQHATAIAAEALADIGIEAIVTEALAGVDVGAVTAEALAGVDFEALAAEVGASEEIQGAMAGAQGMLVNGSWASNDPEHMATMGLVADYALGEALDSVDVAVEVETEAAEEPASDEG